MNVDTFLTLIATPFILIVTAIFVYVAHHASRLGSSQEEHERKSAGRFAYTETKVDQVRTGIDALHGKLDEGILPQMNEMYRLMARPAAQLEGNHLEKLISDAELHPSKVMDDPEAFFVGVEYDNLKVSTLIRYVQETNHLVFQSFAAALKSQPAALQEQLLEMNQDLIMGAIGIRKVGDHDVLFVNHSVCDANRCVSPSMVKGIIQMLARIQSRIVEILKEQEAFDRPLLADEFMKLENEAAQKMLDAGNTQDPDASEQPDAEVQSEGAPSD